MWKVIIIICTLGNPCVVMEEDPVKLYKFKIENRLALELNSILNIKVNKNLLF